MPLRLSGSALMLLAGSLVTACADGQGERPIDLAELCVSSVCGERVVLLDIPSAENLTFSEDGRLFVSSGQQVVEVTRDGDGAFQATVISESPCGFTGLVVREGHLYAACSDGRFWGARLEPHPRLRPIHRFADMCLANGAALGADGRIYVVDEPLMPCVPDPKIKRLTLDPADPLRVIDEALWLQGSPLGQLHLGLDTVLRFPNGLQSRGRRFFGTDGGSIYAVDLQADGSAGPVQPLHFEPDIHDDLGIAGEGLLLAQFGTGRITLLGADGAVLQSTDPGTFRFPSSVRLGRPPMFAPTDVLVTETGVLGDNNLPLDHLSLFRRRAD